MAKKRYINTMFWDDAYIVNLDPSEKLLFIYLITNPNTNISGIYQISLKRISLDTGVEKEMCEKIIGRFQRDDKVLYKDGWIVITNFVKNQNVNSPFIQVGIERELMDVPDELIPSIHGIDTLLKKHISISQSKGISKGNKTVFIKPAIKEITEYCKERKNKVNPEQFFNYYESNGWKVGKNKMVSWKHAVHTWERNNFGKEQDKLPSERMKEKGII